MSKNIGNTIYDRSINYYETDQMGIVHHSNYIRYFEEARLDMMEQVGLSYAAMEEHGLIIPVLSVACEYIKPVLFGEKVQIHTRLVKFDGIKMQFVYEIYCDDRRRHGRRAMRAAGGEDAAGGGAEAVYELSRLDGRQRPRRHRSRGDDARERHGESGHYGL